MLKVVFQDYAATALPQMSLRSVVGSELGFQNLIVKNWDTFAAELGEELFFIHEKVAIGRLEMDILAVDSQGNGVVVELKLERNVFQHVQALTYLAMLRDWSPHKFVGLAGKSRAEGLRTFVASDEALINSGQRIILIAEKFDNELLTTVRLLIERGIEIACYRVTTFGDTESLSHCLRIEAVQLNRDATDVPTYAPPRRRPEASKRRGTEVENSDVRSWTDVCKRISNEKMRAFFESAVANGAKPLPSSQRIVFNEVTGKEGWRVKAPARTEYAWVMQNGRFSGDVEFWKELLTHPETVSIQREGRRVHFHLYAHDLDAFLKAVRGRLRDVHVRDEAI